MRAAPSIASALFAAMFAAAPATPAQVAEGAGAEDAPPPLRAAAALQPVAGLVEALGAGRWSCRALVRPGADPHTWEPSPRDVAALSGARLFVTSGMPFENVLSQRASARNPSMRVVELEEDHPHHGSKAHSDPHGWLSPHELSEWADTISAALSAADPDGAPAYAEALADWRAKLESLERAVRVSLRPGLVFGAAHPAYGPFAEAFGLEQVALETDGHEPGPRTLALAKRRLREGGARTILVQNDAEARRCAVLAAEAGIRVARVSPLARDPLEAIREVAAALARESVDEQGASGSRQ